ncbi:hypothetical protein O3M35_004129 [Rhynocoris fuscipes]|uniref:Uncharacterized protein n=1 Tax=Rhynocoris fuscipes TaxID=488301 RepID=A0AAW1CGC5_9HEMI
MQLFCIRYNKAMRRLYQNFKLIRSTVLPNRTAQSCKILYPLYLKNGLSLLKFFIFFIFCFPF